MKKTVSTLLAILTALLLLTNGLPVESLAAKGLLANLWPLIEGTRLTRSRIDDGLRAIIDEELSAFFAGARDAKETAGLIQDRAGTWIKEQL